MSVTAERSAAASNEPDRLDGFSAPREVDRLFGHEAAISEFTELRWITIQSGHRHYPF